MAYFPNCATSEVLDRQCESCPLGDWQTETICPVVEIHELCNDEQMKPGQGYLREVMRMLVSDDEECQVRKQLIGAGVIKESEGD